MARFYGSMDGKARTTATREGSAASGVQAHIRGWANGAKISVEANDRQAGPGEEIDCVTVQRTGGSGGASHTGFLCWWDTRSPDVVEVNYCGRRYRLRPGKDGMGEVVLLTNENGEEVEASVAYGSAS